MTFMLSLSLFVHQLHNTVTNPNPQQQDISLGLLPIEESLISHEWLQWAVSFKKQWTDFSLRCPSELCVLCGPASPCETGPCMPWWRRKKKQFSGRVCLMHSHYHYVGLARPLHVLTCLCQCNVLVFGPRKDNKWKTAELQWRCKGGRNLTFLCSSAYVDSI